jgi:hypothetical protein
MLPSDRTHASHPLYSDIDVSFFLVTVDLWSEDGAQEMNLVLHPSSQDRVMNSYLPQPKARRRGGSVVSASTSRQHQQMSPETAHSTPATSATTVTAPHYSVRSAYSKPSILISSSAAAPAIQPTDNNNTAPSPAVQHTGLHFPAALNDYNYDDNARADNIP